MLQKPGQWFNLEPDQYWIGKQQHDELIGSQDPFSQVIFSAGGTHATRYTNPSTVDKIIWSGAIGVNGDRLHHCHRPHQYEYSAVLGTRGISNNGLPSMGRYHLQSSNGGASWIQDKENIGGLRHAGLGLLAGSQSSGTR